MKAAILAAPLLLLATIAQARDISSEIDAANAKWIAAFNKGDAAAVAQLYTERATALPPGAPMAKGRAAIQAFWDGAIKDGVKNVTLKSVQVNQFGNAAREIGEFQPRRTERTEADDARTGKVCRAVAECRWRLEARHRYLEQQPVSNMLTPLRSAALSRTASRRTQRVTW